MPLNQTFDWVDRVSIELTTQMLATLFDFPWAERRKLTHPGRRHLATAMDLKGYVPDNRRSVPPGVNSGKCVAYFSRMWNERVNAEPRPDLISMLAHSEAFRNMPPQEFLGTLILLIVGGNDTTRNLHQGRPAGAAATPPENTPSCAPIPSWSNP